MCIHIGSTSLFHVCFPKILAIQKIHWFVAKVVRRARFNLEGAVNMSKGPSHHSAFQHFLGDGHVGRERILLVACGSEDVSLFLYRTNEQ